MKRFSIVLLLVLCLVALVSCGLIPTGIANVDSLYGTWEYGLGKEVYRLSFNTAYVQLAVETYRMPNKQGGLVGTVYYEAHPYTVEDNSIAVSEFTAGEDPAVQYRDVFTITGGEVGDTLTWTRQYLQEGSEDNWINTSLKGREFRKIDYAPEIVTEDCSPDVI